MYFVTATDFNTCSGKPTANVATQL